MARYAQAMGTPIYRLRDLADAAGLEPRTIRSYVEKGLIPGPDSMGPKASYGPGHLHRLKVIGLLRDARREITLDQIRQLLAQLSESQIEAIAEGRLVIGGLVDSEDTSARTSALDYLRGVETEIPASQCHGPRAASDLNALERLLAALESIDLPGGGAPRSVRSARGDTWHRVRVTPDVELSVRGPLAPAEIATLHRLGDRLRQLLMKGATR